MKKLDLRALACLLAVMLCMAVFSMTALVDGGDYYADELPLETPTVTEQPAEEEAGPVEETEAPAEETPEPAEEPPVETEPEEITGGMDDLSLDDLFGGLISAFTPRGNLSLIDDFNFTGMDSDGNTTSKQFITVQSKTGNYFFIIIDRVADTENVYFLNMVDEADLLALTDTPEDATEPAPVVCTCEDKCYAGHVDTTCPVCATDMTKCTGKEAQPEPTETPDEPEPETPEKKGGGNIALVILLLLAGGGGAAYYFLKAKGKAKPQTKGNDDLDDYDYGADEDEYEFEAYEPEAEGGAPGETEDEDS